MKAPDTTTLGGRIRMVRKSLPGKLSMEKFGEMLGGISTPAVNSYELNNVVPPTSVIALICEKFKVSRQWLENGEGPMFLESEYADELIDEKLENGSEFSKALLRVIAKMSDDDLLAVERMFVALREELDAKKDQGD